MGFNKINAISEKTSHYEVSLIDPAAPQATLTTTYHNPSTGTRSCSEIALAYTVEESISYEELLDVCYRNYIRLYAPAGAALLNASEHPVPAEYMFGDTAWAGQAETITETADWQTFTNFIVVPQQETVETTFTYQLPPAVLTQNSTDETTYTLNVYKQAGAKPHPLTIRLTLPAGTQPTNIQPAPVDVSNQTVVFETTLDQDQTISISYSENNQ